MTAIGAMPEGLDEAAVAERAAAASADPAVLRRYALDARQWVVGPYTGATGVDELRLRAAACLDVLTGGRTASAIPGGVTVSQTPGSAPVVEGPGSDSDPAFTSPSPAPGPVGLDGGTDAEAGGPADPALTADGEAMPGDGDAPAGQS